MGKTAWKFGLKIWMACTYQTCMRYRKQGWKGHGQGKVGVPISRGVPVVDVACNIPPLNSDCLCAMVSPYTWGNIPKVTLPSLARGNTKDT